MRRGERAGVFACGPASLMADVSEAQGKMTANTHLHKETFEW
jgi:ferredoxin-NADP reductase